MDEAEIKEALELLDQEVQGGVVGRAARARRRSVSVSLSVSQHSTANGTPARLATNNGSVQTTPSRQGKATKVGKDKETQTAAEVKVKSSEPPAMDHREKFPGIKPEVGYKFSWMGMTLMVVEAPVSVGAIGGGGRGGGVNEKQQQGPQPGATPSPSATIKKVNVQLTNGETLSINMDSRRLPPPAPRKKVNKKRKEEAMRCAAEDSPSSSKAAKGSGGGATSVKN